MHPSLRPELRGAQRILRSIRPSQSASSHSVVRSFSSYQRWQAQSNPSNNPSKPSDTGPKGGASPITSLPQQIQDLLKSWGNGVFPRILQGQNGQPPTNDQLLELSKTWKDLIRKAEQEKKDVDEALERGEIPTGYRVVEDIKDVPSWLSKAVDELPELPFLVCDDPSKDLKIAPLPSGFQQIPQSSPSLSRGQETDDQDINHAKEPVDVLNKAFYGSMSARRKRARENKSSSRSSEQLPPWFLENNVILSELHSNAGPGVLPISQLPDGSYAPATTASSQAEVVQMDANKPPSTDGDDGQPLEQTHGTGGEQPKPDANHRPPIRPPTHDVQNHIALSDKRYFIEQAQHQELLNTFKGKLQNPSAASRLAANPLALNHLTINHSSKDADTLLDTLVSDLCHDVGADRIRLDVQDISELITNAEVDSEVAQRGSRLSFNIYKEIYSPKNPYEETMFPATEEEDEADDDDESGPPGLPFEISGAVIAGVPNNVFQNLTRSLSPANNSMMQHFLSPERDNQKSIFSSLVEAVMNSHTQARKQKSEDSNDPTDHVPSEDVQSAEVRPLVIQLPNYRALFAHKLSTEFLHQLFENVDRRAGRIMIVGTDCLRDDRRRNAMQNNPSHILDEQNSNSFGVSSNILLTPVFPDAAAETALLKDREQRIRNINARHLWLVLQARGVSLKGLQAGFWSKDYSQEIGTGDWEQLGKSFWSFLQVQRLAALIAGAEESSPRSTPISDALATLASSDSSKVEWARRNQPLSRMTPVTEEPPTNKTLARIRSKASRHEKKLLSGVIEPGKIATTFKDIHIPAETVEALQTLTTLSLVRPEAFRYGVLKSDRIPGLLLYGPPGTGKTLAAKAVAKESGATMLEVSAADLNDMYVGEGEKNVQALFSLAKKLSPCVVFLDEADAMFSARSAQGRRVSHRELLNQFLKEWDGMSNDSGSAFIMVATNRPMDLDDAVLRRLPRRLLVDLPTENDRLEILRIHLRHEALAEDVNLPELAKKTPFYSGSDLKNVAVAAALNAVREENNAAKEYRTKHPDAEEPFKYPDRRLLTMQHFEKALEEISASISEDMSSLKEIKKFDEQYGDRKGRKRKSPRWGFKSPGDADKVLETVKVRS